MSEAAVIYCRVSTAEQAQEGISLEAQEACCRAFCQKNGIKVQGVFVERGESARTTNRPILQEMLSFCVKKRKLISRIVVYKIDRLSRNKNSYFAMQVYLRKFDISIKSATEPLGDDSPVGRLLEGILASVSEFESDLVSQRTKLSMQQARSSGRIVHKAPVGYMLQQVDGGRSVAVHDPERAPFVLKAYEMIASGEYTQADVRRLLTREGFTTPKGKPISSQTFRRILSNRTYAGWVKVSDEVGSVRGDFLPIVSEDLFLRVQVTLEERKYRGRRLTLDNPDFPLRGFVRCGFCGLPLTGCWSQGHTIKYPYYRCRSASCSFGSIRKEHLETSFLDYLRSSTPGPEEVEVSKAAILEHWRRERSAREEEGNSLLVQLESIQQDRQKLRKAFIYDAAIDRSAYEEETERLARLELGIRDQMVQTSNGSEDLPDLLDKAVTVISTIASTWYEGNLEKRRKVQHTLFPTGLSYTKSRWVRTAPNGSEICIYDLFSPSLSCLATPTGIEPVLPA